MGVAVGSVAGVQTGAEHGQLATGLGTGLARFKGLGLKPFSVAFAAALSVGAVSVGMIKLVAMLAQ